MSALANLVRRETEFAAELNRVLAPSRSIQSPEFLKGRTAQLDDIRRALYAPGRQVFICGHRGVGKTSLAHTAAFQRQSAGGRPIMVSCTASSTCFGIIQDVAKQAFPTDPCTMKKTIEAGIRIGASWAALDWRQKLQQGSVPLPSSLTDCARLLEFVSSSHSSMPVVVIDEFDRLSVRAEQALFADLTKLIGDQGIGVNLIFCGIGASIDDLMQAHMSTHRYVHTVELERLGWDPRLEIIDEAASILGIEIDDTSRYRIAKISDGFPHYVHLLCEKLFWAVFLADNGMKVKPELFEVALAEAVRAMKPELKRDYEVATKKYANEYEPVLWAVADGDELQRASREIYTSYERILRQLGRIGPGDDPERKKKFNQMMNRLKSKSHAEILIGTRAGWYEYREKIVRGYARLRAAQHAIELEREHPLQPRRCI